MFLFFLLNNFLLDMQKSKFFPDVRILVDIEIVEHRFHIVKNFIELWNIEATILRVVFVDEKLGIGVKLVVVVLDCLLI